MTETPSKCLSLLERVEQAIINGSTGREEKPIKDVIFPLADKALGYNLTRAFKMMTSLERVAFVSHLALLWRRARDHREAGLELEECFGWPIKEYISRSSLSVGTNLDDVLSSLHVRIEANHFPDAGEHTQPLLLMVNSQHRSTIKDLARAASL